MMTKTGLAQTVIFACLIVYFSQGPFYPAGSIIAKVALATIIFISALFMLKELILDRGGKPAILLAITALLLINLMGFLLSLNYSGNNFIQVRGILTVLLPFFTFYSLSKTGDLSEKHLLYLFLVLLFVFIANFYHSRATLILEQDRENVVSNTAYFFVMLIPFLFFLGKQRLFSLLALVVLLFFTIQAAKRGAIISGAIGSIVFLIYSFINTPKDQRLRNYAILISAFIFLGFYAVHIYETNEFLIRRMEEIGDGGSGRDVIYANLLTAWYNSDSIFNYLFGYGFVATIEYSGVGVMAHNDWLELLINFGLFGVIIYFALFLAMADFVMDKKLPVQYRLTMASIALMWLLQTMFSMFYFSSSSVITMIVLGYLLGQRQRLKRLEST